MALIFIGLKIFRNRIFGTFDPISPGVTFTLLVGGVTVSMWKVKRNEAVQASAADPRFPQQPAAPAADASLKR
ncbi:hypothetical protein [Bradyrhizobium sp.]|uniref:hypothetical protein n=1 Tax=Bradyrhizobium sp. TaxID=376 RepID=UPI002737313A|nr:hypothetical protein [Bradyrhizobium sp.]